MVAHATAGGPTTPNNASGPSCVPGGRPPTMPTMSASVLAHQVGGGTLPAPPWLLSYIGAFALLLTVLALRSSWPAPRLRRFGNDAAPDTADEGGSEPTRPGIGQLVGIALLGLVLAAAIT